MLCCYECEYIVTEEEAQKIKDEHNLDDNCPICRQKPLEKMPDDRLIWVNTYLQDRAYGGPAEGGWWFDYELPQGSLQVCAKDAEKVFRAAAEAAAVENGDRRSDISSVLSEGRFRVKIEFSQGERSPKETPHYE